MAVLAAYVAACVDHRHVLAPRERGVLPILAVSTAQAATAFNFLSGVFATAPNLKGLVERQTADTLTLASGVDIEVRPASYPTIRGVTSVAAICDVIAYWPSDDSANPDREILKAPATWSRNHGRSAGCDQQSLCKARRALCYVQTPFRPGRSSRDLGRQSSAACYEPEPIA
jgi:hypothetical protein